MGQSDGKDRPHAAYREGGNNRSYPGRTYASDQPHRPYEMSFVRTALCE